MMDELRRLLGTADWMLEKSLGQQLRSDYWEEIDLHETRLLTNTIISGFSNGILDRCCVLIQLVGARVV